MATARTHGNRTQINRAEKAWQDANGLVVSVIADLGGTDSRTVGIMHDSGMSYEQIGYDLRIYQDQIVLDGRGNRYDQVVVNRGPNDHGLDIHDEHMGDSGGQAEYSNVQRPVGYQSGAENGGHYQQHSSTASSRSYGNHGMGH